MSREKQIHSIEVHVASIILSIFNNETKILVAKRKSNRSLFPSFWECGGGQVHRGEDFHEAIKNQIKDEFGIEIKVEYPICTYKIDTGKEIIPGIRFICKYDGNLSDIKLTQEELVEYKWITEEEFGNFNLIPGLKDDLIKSLIIYRKITK